MAEHARPDGQVQAVTRHRQVGEIGAHPHAIDVVQRKGTDAFGVGVILVRCIRISGFQASLPEPLGHRQHLLFRVAVDRNRTVAPVEVVRAKGEVGLGLPEVWQHVDERPFRRA